MDEYGWSFASLGRWATGLETTSLPPFVSFDMGMVLFCLIQSVLESEVCILHRIVRYNHFTIADHADGHSE